MAISRGQLVKELLPGLNALFGLEYDRYENEHEEIFDVENSDRAFEEEVMLTGFDQAPVKSEGAGVAFDSAQEAFDWKMELFRSTFPYTSFQKATTRPEYRLELF